jgi:hypothetical protein
MKTRHWATSRTIYALTFWLPTHNYCGKERRTRLKLYGLQEKISKRSKPHTMRLAQVLRGAILRKASFCSNEPKVCGGEHSK